jgi:hypothetical protein
MKQTLLFCVLTLALVACSAPRPAAEPSPAQQAAPAPPPRFAEPPAAASPNAATRDESPAAEKSSEAAESMEEEGAAPASPTPVSPAPGDAAGSADDYDLLTVRYSQFEEALSSGAPRCGEAERLRALVCDLAERICDLVEDLPRSSSGHGQCLDGRQRCEDAKRRYAAQCE